MNAGPLRAALRIARRDAWRARGRSALVVAMIALPVLGVTAAGVVARTFQLDPDERVTRQLGAADATLRWEFDGPLVQQPDEHSAVPSKDARPVRRDAADVRAALPPGSRVLVDRTREPATVRTTAGLTSSEARELDYGDPLARGILRPVAGRAPRTATEVAITPALAARTGLAPGGTVELTRPAGRYTVTGIAEDPSRLDASVLYSLPGTLPAPPGAADRADEVAHSPETWLVDTPRPLTWSDVTALNRRGITAVSRTVVLDPPPRADVPYYRSDGAEPGAETPWVAVLAVTLVVGMALLEVVLLAGPAFAVGARRQRRQLALVVAAGGSARTVRAIVLAGGVVLGAAGALVGVAAGVAAAAALRPWFETVGNVRSGALDVRILEVGGVALLAVLIGLLAAAVPAWSASRQDTVAALAGRRGITRSRRRYVVLGAVLAAGGAALAAGSAALPVSQSAVRMVPLLAGIVAAEVGVVLCRPAILGAVASLGRWLPLSPRIALRDTARNRASAAPAVAAIMAAVAGTVAVGLTVASGDALERARYQPGLPAGNASVTVFLDPGRAGDGTTDDGLAATLRTALQRTLPASDVYALRSTQPGCSGQTCTTVEVAVAADQRCPVGRTQASPAELARYRTDPRCESFFRQPGPGGEGGSYVIDDGSALGALTGAPAADLAAARRTLRAGGVVLHSDRGVTDGRVALNVVRTDITAGGPPQTRRQLTVPAYVLDTDLATASGMVSPAVARTLADAGVGSGGLSVVADTTRMPTRSEEEAAREAVEALTTEAYFMVERGYQSDTPLLLLALTVIGAVVTLGAAAIATGLAAADGRADLVTLGAVGASPRIRRLLALSQAGVVAGLGTVLGVVAGFVASGAIVLTLATYDRASEVMLHPVGPDSRSLVVPWLMLALTAVVVPAVAMLGAGLFTRSRLPAETRRAT